MLSPPLSPHPSFPSLSCTHFALFFSARSDCAADHITLDQISHIRPFVRDPMCEQRAEADWPEPEADANFEFNFLTNSSINLHRNCTSVQWQSIHICFTCRLPDCCLCGSDAHRVTARPSSSDRNNHNPTIIQLHSHV